jgi:hypothetical protein
MNLGPDVRTGDREDSNSANYRRESPSEARMWKFIYGLTFVTIMLSLGVSTLIFQQGKDRKIVSALAKGNRQITCDVQKIRANTKPETELEKKISVYFSNHKFSC